MKTVLVPTDFSKNAKNALDYAVELAIKLNARLIVLHCLDPFNKKDKVPYDIIMQTKEENRKEAVALLQSFMSKIRLRTQIKTETILVEELPIDGILKTIKKRNIDMVIMGTKGASGIGEVVFGSVAAKVIEKASCPVIVVPEKAGFLPIKKLTYATDYKTVDLTCIQMIVDFAILFNAQINILHISDSTVTPEEEKSLMEKFMKQVNEMVNYNNLSFQLLNGESIEEALENYVYADSTNILVMSTHHRNLLDRLFLKSLTKHMVYQTNIPLMVFHYDDTTSVNFS